MKIQVFDHKTLVDLNGGSIRAVRSQNLNPEQLFVNIQGRHWVNAHGIWQRDGQVEVRMCVVLSLNTGPTAWLDVSIQEFATIPEVDVPYLEWTAAMCAGNPPPPSPQGYRRPIQREGLLIVTLSEAKGLWWLGIAHSPDSSSFLGRTKNDILVAMAALEPAQGQTFERP